IVSFDHSPRTLRKVDLIEGYGARTEHRVERKQIVDNLRYAVEFAASGQKCFLHGVRKSEIHERHLRIGLYNGKRRAYLMRHVPNESFLGFKGTARRA